MITIVYVYNDLGDRISSERICTAQDTRLTWLQGLLRSSRMGPLLTCTAVLAWGRIRVGSVRQLANDTSITLTKEYEPYGEVLAEEGKWIFVLGYRGELPSHYNELVYLRAR